MTKFEQQTSSESSISNAPDRTRTSNAQDEIHNERMAQSISRSERTPAPASGTVQFSDIYNDCQTRRTVGPMTERERNWRPDANSNSDKAQDWRRSHEEQRQKSFGLDKDGTYKVEKGDSLSGIAQRSLKSQGNEHSTYKDIQREMERLITLNPELKGNAHLVKPGMSLRTYDDTVCRRGSTDAGQEPNVTHGRGSEANITNGRRSETHSTNGRGGESYITNGPEGSITNRFPHETNINGGGLENGITNRRGQNNAGSGLENGITNRRGTETNIIGGAAGESAIVNLPKSTRQQPNRMGEITN